MIEHYNYFFILLNQTFAYTQKTKDRIFKCTPDIYSDIKLHRKEFPYNQLRLHSYIEKSCVIARLSEIISQTFPKTIINLSEMNKTFNFIAFYNADVFKYEKLNFDSIKDLECSIKDRGWFLSTSDYLKNIYNAICTFDGDYYSKACLSKYNPALLNNIKIFEMLNDFCFTTNTNSYSKDHSSNDYITWLLVTAAIALTTGCGALKIFNLMKKHCVHKNQNNNIESQNTFEIETLSSSRVSS